MRLVFMGTPEIAVPSLEAVVEAGHEVALVVTRPDRPAGRGRRLRRGAVAAAADRLGLAVVQPERVAEAAAEFAARRAEAACVLAYGQILPPPVLAAFPRGCINVHFSLLPRLRGAAPINHAILQGLAETGVTTMFMDQGLDTGDIILQRATPLEPQDTAGSLARRLAGMGAELLVETLALLEAGRAPRTPQDHSRATWAPRLGKSDGRVDWTRPARELDRQVRGLDPWPAAFTSWAGRQLRLFAPTRLLPRAQGGRPGQVMPPPPGEDAFLWVATGQGWLGLGQVQAAGKRRLPATQWLRGARLSPGARLGVE